MSSIEGNGYGNGYGNGSGSGYGDGDGSGSGDGDGSSQPFVVSEYSAESMTSAVLVSQLIS